LITLGIETSCDETSCGIIDENLHVLSNQIYTQLEEHTPFGGVVPEVAARAHLEKIGPVVRAALEEAKLALHQVDLICYTRGPGLMGPLLIGASFAKGLAQSLGIPCAGINHLEGHIAANFLSFPHLKPPFLCLTVSGGHTELVLVEPGFRYKIIGKTRDDAAGEAFDKCGKILGLGYPAGPLIGKLAAQGNRKFVRFPRGLKQDTSGDFSFSGLKSAVLRYKESQTEEYIQANINDICASVEEAIVEILVEKTFHKQAELDIPQIMICGGVSANRRLREQMQQAGRRRGVSVHVPDFSYCTDNGAMIAAAAQLRFNQGVLDISSHDVKPWFPINSL
jgi:N6-L-threonylcarbamoyladenine synthase